MTLFLFLLSCVELSSKYATDDDGDGYSEFQGDCDDANRFISPGATEYCDGIDNDCNNIVDQDSEDAKKWYPDNDGDGYGLTEQEITACTPPANHIEEDGDCDDLDPNINEGATEICDEEGVDENCNDIVNEAEVGGVASEGVQTFYVDIDNDGYGNPNDSVLLCEVLSGYTSDFTDCNDQDATINTDGIEICDEQDNDCDGTVDEDFTEDGTTYYRDADEDGFGDPSEETQLVSCMETAPEGYVSDSTDCNDANAYFNPNADEFCNEADEDCDGETYDDESINAPVFFLDSDGDGFGVATTTTTACFQPEGYALTSTDCDDSQSGIFPSAQEICDGVDNNCDEAIDDSSAIDESIWYLDSDGDAFGDVASYTYACNQPQGYVSNSTDCNDGDAALNQSDSDGDGATSCGGDCDDEDANLNLLDADGDGFTSCAQDCNDQLLAINPSAAEMCDDIDNNCDGVIDPDDSVDAPTWYIDSDNDGSGVPATFTTACSKPDGYVGTSDDCDDSNASLNQQDADGDEDTSCDGDCDDDNVELNLKDLDGDGFSTCAGDCEDLVEQVNPSAVEVCDGLDNNCDGLTDDSSAEGRLYWYPDSDEDGFGALEGYELACTVPEGFTADSSDCDDDDPNQNPDASELCATEEDDNCNGVANEDSATDASLFYLDADLDGYGTDVFTAYACEQSAGFSEFSTDCDDASILNRPGGDELCDGVDNDCDGLTDELLQDDPSSPAQDTILYYVDSDGDSFGEEGSSADIAACPGSEEELENIANNNSDCDDTDELTYPGAPEDCAEVDRNCDGDSDLGAIDPVPWYVDADNDGYGDPNSYFEACTAPSGFLSDSSDCSDIDGDVYPGAPEKCNGKLDDCTSESEVFEEAYFEADQADFEAGVEGVVIRKIPLNEWDHDGDGHVECELDVEVLAWESSQRQKVVDGELVGLVGGEDCDDEDERFYTGAALYEPDDACVKDEDGDGWGDSAADEPYDVGFDCDDTRDYVFPSAPETCNGRHDDCEEYLNDGGIPEDEQDNDGDGQVECDRPDAVPEWFGEDGLTYVGEDGLMYVNGGDCNDNVAYIYQGAAVNQPEICAQDEDGDGDPDCVLSSLVADYECDVGVFLDSGLGVDFVLIEGDDLIDPGIGEGSRYTLKNPFYIMTTEVTQEVYEELMGENPSSYPGPQQPVERLKWKQAAAFANALSVHQELEECYTCTEVDGDLTCVEAMNPYRCTGYRLPTESEWELAARSGTAADFWTGDGEQLGGTYNANNCNGTERIEDGVDRPLLDDYAWYCGNNPGNTPKDVAQKLPNGFGLYDTVGNVKEWTGDEEGCIRLNGDWCFVDGEQDRVYKGGAFSENPDDHILGDRSESGGSSFKRGFRLVKAGLEDADGDGVSNVKDCDDANPEHLSYEQDRDCDEVLSVEDCDDENPLTADIALDADCDGLMSYNDCDDSDPTSLSDYLDKDCDGVSDVDIISAGGSHSCGMDVGGSVQCWGNDWAGQVSDAPSGSFVQVSSGEYHSCAIDISGSVHCWGITNDSSQDYGQVSDTPSGTFTQVSVGPVHSCGIDNGGGVYCWGYNESGQSTPLSGAFVQISSGWNHVCGIDVDGGVQCWGNDNYGQISSPSGTFVQVSSGYYHTCAVDIDGDVHCWGYDNEGQVSDAPSGQFVQVSAGLYHSCGIDIDGYVQCWGSDSEGQISSPSGTFVQVSAGGSHSCGIGVEGAVQCWGDNSDDQVSDTPLYTSWNGQCDTSLDGDCDAVLPEYDCNDLDAASVTIFEDYDCDGALDEYDCNDLNPDVSEVTEGDWDCDGVDEAEDCDPENMFATFTDSDADCDGVETELDCDDTDSTAVSTTIDATCDGVYDVEVISSGDAHVCGIDVDGLVHCWGYENAGQVSNRPSGHFTQVSSAGAHSCAIDVSGSVQCWGDDYYGQSSPLSGTFVLVSSGGAHNCGIDIDGSVQCWGNDDYGQVSDVPSGTFVQVSNAGAHSCAIDISGSVQCWGYDYHGEVSDAPSGSFVQVSAGYFHNCAIDIDGAVQCWGRDDVGQVSQTPSGEFVRLSAGIEHNCGIDISGSIQCWGDDYEGQVSDAPSGTFVQVSAGGSDSCAIDIDGAVQCWGSNHSGVSTPPSNFRAWNGGQYSLP